MTEGEFKKLSVRYYDALISIVMLKAENKRLRKAIEDYLNSEFPNPSISRKNGCKHGTVYYQECNLCNVEHFTVALQQDKEGEE